MFKIIITVCFYLIDSIKNRFRRQDDTERLKQNYPDITEWEIEFIKHIKSKRPNLTVNYIMRIMDRSSATAAAIEASHLIGSATYH